MIYVGFGFDAGSWLSRVIAWFTGARISHTFFLLRDPVFGWVVLGSEARGFYPMAATVWPSTYVVDLFEVPGLEAALGKNRGALGKPYDFGGLVGMSWVMAAWRLFRARVRNPLSRKSAWFCSAVVDQVFIDAGMSCPQDPRVVSPAMLRDFLASGGYRRASFEEVIAS